MKTSAKEYINKSFSPKFIYFLKSLINKVSLIVDFIYDYRRYKRWSTLGGIPRTADQTAATITMDYHRIEKGLSLPEPRPGFGLEVVRRIALNIPRYIGMEGKNKLPLQASYGALKQWIDLSEGSIGENEAKRALSILSGCVSEDDSTGGAITFKKADVEKTLHSDFKTFFESRYSIRNYSDEPLKMEDIREAVSIAKKTPSVCNRQCWRVHAFLEPEMRSKVLSVQKGNRGFGDKATGVLVVTSDLQSFFSSGERYQGWIDGGMFAMSLLLALHYKSIASCCLNWSVSSRTDKKLRKVMSLPGNEQVIMMIAIGNMRDEFKVASSPRLNTSDILFEEK